MRVAEMSVAVWFLAWAHGATLIRSERIRPGQRSSNDTRRNYSAAGVVLLANIYSRERYSYGYSYSTREL